MEIRHPMHPDNGKALDTEGLRREFLVSSLFEAGTLNLVYSHFDRIIVGGVVPTSARLPRGMQPADAVVRHLMGTSEDETRHAVAMDALR
jgi:5-keto 4-deoxyuronate isomerase